MANLTTITRSTQSNALSTGETPTVTKSFGYTTPAKEQTVVVPDYPSIGSGLWNLKNSPEGSTMYYNPLPGSDQKEVVEFKVNSIQNCYQNSEILPSNQLSTKSGTKFTISMKRIYRLESTDATTGMPVIVDTPMWGSVSFGCSNYSGVPDSARLDSIKFLISMLEAAKTDDAIWKKLCRGTTRVLG